MRLPQNAGLKCLHFEAASLRVFGGFMNNMIQSVRKYRKRMRMIKSLIRNRKKIPGAVEALIQAGKSYMRR